MRCGITLQMKNFTNMKLGFVLVSSVGNEIRSYITTRSFQSLEKTNTTGIEKPTLMLMYNPCSIVSYDTVTQGLLSVFNVHTSEDKAVGLNALVSVAGDMLLAIDDSITHIGFLWDDFIYNPDWLKQLTALIQRHPDAMGWSVYRSRYTRHHRIVGTDGTDVLMTMHDGLGCMTIDEWKEYDPLHISDYTCPESMGGGCTIDIHHAYARPGERWATSRDYMENLGRHSGIEDVDCAIDFVGETVPKMNIGLVFSSFVYNDERKVIVDRALNSLAKTNVEGVDKPYLRITYRPSDFDYNLYVEKLSEKFNVDMVTDHPEVPYPDSNHVSVQSAASHFLNYRPEVTHIMFLCDDYIYNPEWLKQLYALVERHPDGIAWAVFRSSYSYYHQVVGGDDTDCLMSMHDSIGCITRGELFEFIKNGYVPAPDINHSAMRPGNRWATKRDYMQNLGRHPGIEDVDCAIDFVGEE